VEDAAEANRVALTGPGPADVFRFTRRRDSIGGEEWAPGRSRAAARGPGGRHESGAAQGAEGGAVTERVRVAALPDGTPAEELPLSRRTSNVLRAGSVLTLGDLRAMPDRELRRLRGFGRGALTEVRSLVPAPEERGRAGR
jgi:hypothetical protein